MKSSKVLAPETPEVTKNRRSPRKRAQEAEASPLKTKNKAREASPVAKPKVKKVAIKLTEICQEKLTVICEEELLLRTKVLV